jgi:uracil phosphoribosyltransferase
MEKLGGEHAIIADKMGCSHNPHRKQSWSPIIMTDTILATGNTGTVRTEEVVRQISEKDIDFLKSLAFSKVTLTFEDTTKSKPMTLRKFAEGYAEKELREA